MEHKNTATRTDWPVQTVHAIFDNITAERKRLKLSAQDLSDRCAKIGMPIDRRVISKMDNHTRIGISVPELVVLAEALGTAPVDLIYSPYVAGSSLQRLPGQLTTGSAARDLFSSFDERLASFPVSETTQLRTLLEMRSAEIEGGERALQHLNDQGPGAPKLPDGYVETLLNQVKTAALNVEKLDSKLAGFGVQVPEKPDWVSQAFKPKHSASESKGDGDA